MNFKRTLAGALALSLLALGGCGQTKTDSADTDSAQKGTAVETVTVSRGEIYNESRLSGRIIASREVAVMAPLPSKVMSVNVKVGDTVGKDQVLFTLDPKDIQKNYQPLLDNYNRTKKLAEESIRQAQKNVDDTQALLEIGAASQSQLDQANLALLQQQTSTESQLSQLNESMKDINDTLKDAAVKAPIAGVVTTVNIVENNNASQAAAAVMISENQKPQVSVSVAETLIPSIKVGDPVDITVPAVSANPFTANIRSISPNTSAQTQLYEVKMDVPADAGYTVGMFANVTFRMNRHENAVIIPSEAIQTDGQASWVYIINDQGTASKITVTTGLENGEGTEILEGLAGGEQLVVKGQSYLSEGIAVRVVVKDGQEVTPAETAPNAAPDAQQPTGDTKPADGSAQTEAQP